MLLTLQRRVHLCVSIQHHCLLVSAGRAERLQSREIRALQTARHHEMLRTCRAAPESQHLEASAAHGCTCSAWGQPGSMCPWVPTLTA